MNAQRLMDLARFLHNKLPEHKFRFSSILRGTDIPNETFSCGTVGCAIGWAPLVFPEHLRYVQLSENDDPEVVVTETGMRLHVSEDYSSVALREFFGITCDEAQVLFMPNGQRGNSDFPLLGRNATSKAVARNIALFVSRRQPEFDTTL